MWWFINYYDFSLSESLEEWALVEGLFVLQAILVFFLNFKKMYKNSKMLKVLKKSLKILEKILKTFLLENFQLKNKKKKYKKMLFFNFLLFKGTIP